MGDVSFAVVGVGEVGRRIGAALDAAGVPWTPVTRSVGWDDIRWDSERIVLVCVREEHLGGVLQRLEGRDPRSVVLVQNGWIRPLLDDWSGCTRGLIWFTSKGEFFRSLRPSLFAGHLAGAITETLGRGGLAAEAVTEGEFCALEAEKMGFNCVVGLPLAVHQVSLAEYLGSMGDEAEALFRESAETCAEALGVPASPVWWDAFRTAAEPIGWMRASAAKALEYRSGAVLRIAGELGREVPTTRRLLAATGFGV
jgi:hypothetical protein